jgi:hypothetical protein
VWEPAAAETLRYVIATRHAPHEARPGEPLTISIRMTEPADVTSVRLRYRHVTQFEDYATLEMAPGGVRGELTATIPGEFIVPEWDVMYFFEIGRKGGQGLNHPTLTKGPPYVTVKVTRE